MQSKTVRGFDEYMYHILVSSPLCVHFFFNGMHHSCSLKQLFWNHARWDWSISEKVWVCCLDCALSLPLRAIVIGRCWIEIGVHWLTEAWSWRLAINAWRTQVELGVAALFQSYIIQLYQKSIPLISEQIYHWSTLYKRESFKWIFLNLN